MPKSKLQTIAGEMRQNLTLTDRPQAWIRHDLPGGLELILSRAGEQWRLALRRENVPPGDTEVTVCADVFGVPEGTEPARYERKETKAATGRLTRYHVVELIWREIPAPERRAPESRAPSLPRAASTIYPPEAA